MNKLFALSTIYVVFFLVPLKAKSPATWVLDKMHAKVGFSVTHNMASDVEGIFRSFTATIITKGEDFTNSSIDFSADAASITTDNVPRDKDIKSDALLDVEKFPKLMFKSTDVVMKSAFTYQISGTLTLHGITKKISLNALVRIPPAALGLTKTVAGFKITGIIKRSDFNIGSGFTNIMLGDEVTLIANGEFVKQ